MDQQFEKIDQHLQELHQLFLKSQKDSPIQPFTSIVSHPRSIKLDFSWFTGDDDAMTWLYKAEKFFHIIQHSRWSKSGHCFYSFWRKSLTMVSTTRKSTL